MHSVVTNLFAKDGDVTEEAMAFMGGRPPSMLPGLSQFGNRFAFIKIVEILDAIIAIYTKR